jgi:hypothetical protein
MMTDAWNACRESDVIVSSFTSDLYAVGIAEKLHAKHISMPLQPAPIATHSGPATLNAPIPNRASVINYWFGKLLLETGPWGLMGKTVNRFRDQVLGLPPQTREQNVAARKRMLVVHAYSSHVIPPPPDWPDTYHTTGYWFLDESDQWTPSLELLKFLEAGDPPVCLGLGSMTGRDPARITRLRWTPSRAVDSARYSSRVGRASAGKPCPRTFSLSTPRRTRGFIPEWRQLYITAAQGPRLPGCARADPPSSFRTWPTSLFGGCASKPWASAPSRFRAPTSPPKI